MVCTIFMQMQKNKVVYCIGRGPSRDDKDNMKWRYFNYTDGDWLSSAGSKSWHTNLTALFKQLNKTMNVSTIEFAFDNQIREWLND